MLFNCKMRRVQYITCEKNQLLLVKDKLSSRGSWNIRSYQSFAKKMRSPTRACLSPRPWWHCVLTIDRCAKRSRLDQSFFLLDPATGSPWLVFEYMPYGDLAEVLRSNSGIVSLQREDLPILKMVSIPRNVGLKIGRSHTLKVKYELRNNQSRNWTHL